MFEPGDLAIIIQSALGVNVGRIVQCVNVIGDHSLYGTVWNVRSSDPIVSEYGGHGYSVHVPQIWLKKIEPGTRDNSNINELTLQS